MKCRRGRRWFLGGGRGVEGGGGEAGGEDWILCI